MKSKHAQTSDVYTIWFQILFSHCVIGFSVLCSTSGWKSVYRIPQIFVVLPILFFSVEQEPSLHDKRHLFILAKRTERKYIYFICRHPSIKFLRISFTSRVHIQIVCWRKEACCWVNKISHIPNTLQRVFFCLPQKENKIY
jgi:hypothetical protein